MTDFLLCLDFFMDYTSVYGVLLHLAEPCFGF
jgi:hypothetical protein